MCDFFIEVNLKLNQFIYILSVEHDVGFEKHVFLEKELENGFPKKGILTVSSSIVC